MISVCYKLASEFPLIGIWYNLIHLDYFSGITFITSLATLETAICSPFPPNVPGPQLMRPHQ